MLAAVYARVSTREQAKEGTSIAIQLQRCRSYIEAKGWELAGEFIDDGVSGSLDSRPALDRMMTEAAAGNIETVVVSKLDRFTRSTRHLENAVFELDRLGVGFASIADGIDSATATGRMFRSILGAVAQFEREQITERMSDGKWEAAKKKLWMGGPPPFGYRTEDTPDGKHKVLVPDFRDDGTKGDADTVVEAARLLADECMTAKQVEGRLNALGMKPRRADRWRYYNLIRMLRSETLKGRIEFGRTSSQESVTYDIEPVLDEKRWQQLQRALGRTATGTKPQKRRTYQLSGRVTSPCGKPMWGYFRTDRQTAWYKCSFAFVHERPAGVPSCGCRSVRAPDVEEAVWERVVAVLEDSDQLQEAADAYLKTGAAQEGTMREALATVDQEIRVLEDGIAAGLANALRSGQGSDPQLMRRAVATLEKDLAGKLEYRGQLLARIEQSTAEVEWIQSLSQISKRIRGMGPEDRAQILEQLDLQVVVTDAGTRKEPPKLRFKGNLPFDFDERVGNVERGDSQRH